MFDATKHRGDDATGAAAVATLAERAGDVHAAACMRGTVKAMRQLDALGHRLDTAFRHGVEPL